METLSGVAEPIMVKRLSLFQSLVAIFPGEIHNLYGPIREFSRESFIDQAHQRMATNPLFQTFSKSGIEDEWIPAKEE